MVYSKLPQRENTFLTGSLGLTEQYKVPAGCHELHVSLTSDCVKRWSDAGGAARLHAALCPAQQEAPLIDMEVDILIQQWAGWVIFSSQGRWDIKWPLQAPNLWPLNWKTGPRVIPSGQFLPVDSCNYLMWSCTCYSFHFFFFFALLSWWTNHLPSSWTNRQKTDLRMRVKARFLWWHSMRQTAAPRLDHIIDKKKKKKGTFTGQAELYIQGCSLQRAKSTQKYPWMKAKCNKLH